MSAPHFRLASLLRLRESTRERRRVALAESRRTDAELLERLQRLGVEQKRVEAQCRKAAAPGTLPLSKLTENHRYAASLRSERDAIRRRRESLAIEIERRRQAVVAAERDVKVLEKLRENELARQRLGEARRSAKQLDEAALRTVQS